MKMKELQSKSIAELQSLLSEQRAKLRDLRFYVSSDQHKQVRDIRQVRKLIARIMTILNKSATTSSSDQSDKNLNK